MPQPITTTAKETFTGEESQAMARLLFKRFGRDLAAATAAWRRMLQNGTTEAQFEALLAE